MHSLLGAALAVLVLCAGLAPARATATEESVETADDGTITTVLQPGWNMVGWLGPDAPATVLFDALPVLAQVSAWDGDEQRYQHATRNSAGLLGLTPGRGLWLLVGGTATVEWERPVSEAGVLLQLRTGKNLVGWAGGDGVAIEEALGRFGGALVRASRWDPVAQRYEGYRPGAADFANPLRDLNQGDALWVELSGAARWWQSGTAEPRFVFTEDISVEDRQAVRAMLGSVRAVFAERFGMHTADVTVYVRASPEEGQGTGACGADTRVLDLTLGCALTDWIVALAYFQMLQAERPFHGARGPTWLTAGTADYMATASGGLLAPDVTVAAALDDRRNFAVSQVVAIVSTLSSIEASAAFYDIHGHKFLAFLAADWLAEHVSESALIDYFGLLPSSGEWEEAFEDAFGITVEDFYTAFEAYRGEVAPPFPHLTDDDVKPLVEFLGDVPPHVRVAIQAELDSVHSFISDRFGAEPQEYSLYYGVDRESAIDTVDKLAHSFVDARPHDGDEAEFCGLGGGEWMVHTMTCDRAFDYKDHFRLYFGRVFAGTNFDPEPPRWLMRGGTAYVEAVYRAAHGVTSSFLPESYDEESRRHAAVVQASDARLQQIVSHEGWWTVSYKEKWALSFLAVEWLVGYAGEPALLEYYRLLPEVRTRRQEAVASWQEAFETAFGIAVDDFYGAFEAYRAEVAPPSEAAGAS